MPDFKVDPYKPPDLLTASREHILAHYGPQGEANWQQALEERAKRDDVLKRRAARDMADKRRALKLRHSLEMSDMRAKQIRELADLAAFGE